MKMMNTSKYLWMAFVLAIGLSACKKEDPVLGEAPTEADAQFTFAPSATNPNIIEFTAVNQDIRTIWDLGNGATTSGTTVTGIYPNADTYTVKLSVFGHGGSASTTQQVVIANDDPTLLDDPVFNMLTGGNSGPGSKTWVIDSANAGHFGVGPDPISAAGPIPEWYAAGAGDKSGVGMYDDRYVFYLNNFQFDMVNNGHVYVHNELAGDFPGSYENLTDYTAPYTVQLGESWNITQGADTTLTISGDAFIGMYTGVQTYRIIEITDTTLKLQYKHHSGGLHWYLNLIPEGWMPSGGGGGPTGATLPIDFESQQPAFTTFGGSTYQVVSNPDPSGINTSSNVLETVHGNETWAGLFVDLENPLDFSTQTNISIKIWSPTTDTVRFKVENSGNTNDFVELDAVVSTPNTWETVSVDFAGSASGVYDRIVLFPGWGVPNAGTFYIDDITQQ